MASSTGTVVDVGRSSATTTATTTVGPARGGALAAVPALGKVRWVKDGRVAFVPAGQSYELHLAAPGYAGPIGTPVRGVVRVTARKVWTVASGGNFIAPITGTPRIIQGRVKSLAGRALVVHGGVDVWVDLPDSDIVYDLANGAIGIGRMVNVTAMPGATFTLSE